MRQLLLVLLTLLEGIRGSALEIDGSRRRLSDKDRYALEEMSRQDRAKTTKEQLERDTQY